MFNKKIISLIICILLLCSMLVGCGEQQVEQQDGEGKKEVSQEIVAGVRRDPGLAYGHGAFPPLTRVLETLIFRDVDLELKPGLATGWEVSDDGLTWTIQLREGVRFHDGTPFNAEVAKHNLERVLEKWPRRYGPIELIEAIDEYTVKVIHNKPFPMFLWSLAWPAASMISPAAIDDEGKVIEPVGTGLFKRTEWIQGERMVLKRNEDYWGTKPKIERVTLKVIPDPTTRVMALEAGEIDMIICGGGVLPEHVQTLRMHPEIEVLTVTGTMTRYVFFNNRESPFNDMPVRQAVMHALDPESITKYALEGYGTLMSSFVPHSEIDWMHPQPLLQFNKPDKAQELLQEAGWVDTDGDGIREKEGEKLEITFLLAKGCAQRQTIAEILLDQLRDIGMIVNIEIVDSGLWRERVGRGEFEMSIRGWSQPFVAPQSRFYDWLYSEGFFNIAMGIFYNNPHVDELVQQLVHEIDIPKAQEISFVIQEIVAEEVPVIPIHDVTLINAVRSNIKGYEVHPMRVVNWEDIYVAGASE